MVDPSQVLATHLLNQIHSSLAILEQLKVVQTPDAETIRRTLPNPNGPFPSLDTSFNKLAVTSPPSLPQRQEARGRALWDYTGNEPSDLKFRAGDVIVIDEEVNDQWYRGRVIPQGEQYPRDYSGLFPCSYVEKITTHMVPYQPPPPPQPTPHYQPVQQYQPEPEKKHKFGKMGSTLQHSAVGGLGFGAGSAIGSGLINKIF